MTDHQNSSAATEDVISRLVARAEYHDRSIGSVGYFSVNDAQLMKDAAKALRTFTDAQAAVVPVAWRWKPRRSRNWIACDKLPEFTDDADVITEALYSGPVAHLSAATELVRQLRQKAGWRNDVHGDLHRAAADEIERLIRNEPQAAQVTGDGYGQ